jgi:hypothetical protein
VVAGSDTKAMTNNVEIWSSEDTSTSDALTKQTAAKAYTVANNIKNKVSYITFKINSVN